MEVKSLSRVRLLATPWTAAYQAPLSMGFSRQEYWSGVPTLEDSSFFGLRRASRLAISVSQEVKYPHLVSILEILTWEAGVGLLR